MPKEYNGVEIHTQKNPNSKSTCRVKIMLRGEEFWVNMYFANVWDKEAHRFTDEFALDHNNKRYHTGKIELDDAEPKQDSKPRERRPAR